MTAGRTHPPRPAHLAPPPSAAAAGERRRTGWRLAALGAVALVLAGCAERRLVAEPSSRPGTGAWVAVWLAAAVCSAVAGVLLTRPVWEGRPRARLAAALLTLQAGGAAVLTLVLAGVAIRTGQLVDRPRTAAPVDSLVRLSQVDGDDGFYALMVLMVVALGTLTVTITAAAARGAAVERPLERLMACGVLAVELGAAAFFGVGILLGHRGWPNVVGLISVPLLVAAVVTCWPRSRPERQRGRPAPGPARLAP